MDVVEGDVYPDVSGLASAFVGFCAAFHGRQDCAHIEAAGLRAVCVDRDGEKLDQMRDLYPGSWDFVEGDVWQDAERRFALGQRFDLVSLDPFTSQMQDVADSLDLWLSIARVKVVLGTGRDTYVPLDVDGWTHGDHLKRSKLNGGVFWTVYDRNR